ncbi:MAG: DUF2500 domain-containing protein [Oscillospiraceae bacterium]|jgi:hypothetical protein|nr:DUF2500 domain-containing protein [Oscillospiraceae bacterium]
MIVIFIVLFILIVPSDRKRERELKAMPEQVAWVEIIKKEIRTEGSDPQFFYSIATFKTSDGIEIELQVFRDVYKTMQEGDTGMLTYKALENSTRWTERNFISFEKE